MDYKYYTLNRRAKEGLNKNINKHLCLELLMACCFLYKTFNTTKPRQASDQKKHTFIKDLSKTFG